MADEQARAKCGETGSFSLPTKQTSMCSLIIWNISKALEKNPCIDFTHAVRTAHDRLERESRVGHGAISKALAPEERHVTCALLAWHQLGHKNVDSLCRFIEENHNKPKCNTSENFSNDENIESVNKAEVSAKSNSAEHKRANIKHVGSKSFDTLSLMGPVVKLPVESKIVMRLENTSGRPNMKKPQKNRNDVTNKIDAACCMDFPCMQLLSELDKAVTELRNRAAKLARREADRAELLERAEAAWKDIELGYQRRISLAVEKEDDMSKQIKKIIEERNAYKNACTALAGSLKERAVLVEKERTRLLSLEKDVCERACIRHRHSEESAKGDAALAEQLCRATQLDRDLQLKEEQTRRQLLSLESEVESCRCLTLVVERALRSELAALKNQVSEVSNKLLAEENSNNSMKAELEQFRQEKANMIEDLDGCKDLCDGRVKSLIDELNNKREQLKVLKEKVIECRCKLPLDAAVEVKRTPSLAALCRCTPEDKILASCSCTSLRSQLLSDLLADLFGGLQTELSGSGTIMPCGLLLCLDDRHNWNRTTAVKTNLRHFFAKLLIGELNIAIATSIEKYHAKWVGATCADQARMIPDPGEDENEGWQQRAIERRAQQLAAQLAEQLFEEKAEELTRKANEIVSSGPPPCICKGHEPALYPCLVKAPNTNSARKSTAATPSYMKRTMQDVNQLKLQIEDLKKESIKKEDLRHMEEKIAKIIHRSSKVDNATTIKSNKSNKGNQEILSLKNNNTVHSIKKKELDTNNCKKNVTKSPSNQTGRIQKKNSNKMFKKLEQSFAVNLCLCSDQGNSNKRHLIQRKSSLKSSWNRKYSKDLITNIPSMKQSNPIASLVTKDQNYSDNNIKSFSVKSLCPKDCMCFHKVPSNTSIDKLLLTLTKWNGSLNEIVEGTNIPDKENNNNMPFTYELETKTLNNDNAKSADIATASYQLNTDVSNKSTICETTVPPTTESEYIGTVNLDKSNDNVCHCPVNYNISNPINSDGKNKNINIPYHYLNAEICQCKSTKNLNDQFQEPQCYEYVPSNMKKVSQLYSVEVHKPQFKSAETETEPSNKNISKKNAQISGESFIHDVVRNSQLFPNNCDYFLKFLGVTLTNTNSENKTKQINDVNTYKSCTYLPKSKDNSSRMEEEHKNILEPNQMKNNNSQASCGIRNGAKEFEVDSINEESKISIGLDKQNKEQVANKSENKINCVCCNSLEISKNLEINAFNLLEDHIKVKLGDFQRNFGQSSCLTPEEEKQLFNTILLKVKEVISNSTKGVGCKCCDESSKRGSWSRAYDMLQEYIKVKIKRVQCSCITSDGNVESILPPILEKVSDLIEKDFLRLKQKCLCYNYNGKNCDISKSAEKTNTTTSTRDKICDAFVSINNKNEHSTKIDENILLDVDSCVLVDKSCEVFDKIFKDLNFLEKKVSCELKLYGTDCDCQHKCTEPIFLDKVIVNQCTELISTSIDNMKKNISSSEVTCSLQPIKFKSKSSNVNNGNDYVCCIDVESKSEPTGNLSYVGCTLSCKSLVENDAKQTDYIWKPFNNKTCARKCSYIMNNVLANKKSGCNNSISLDDLQSMKNDRKNMFDIKVSTFDTDENLLLKYSNEGCRTFDEASVGTKYTNNNSSSYWYESEEQYPKDNFQKGTYDKNFLYNSLHLPSPTDKLTKTVASENFTHAEEGSELVPEKCNCNMVPICHVKMLVKNIENKLVQLKCTCDSLNSQICPVHCKTEFSVDQ